MKKYLSVIIAVLIVIVSTLPIFAFPSESDTDVDYRKYEGTTLHVYNWGVYISDGSEGTYDVVENFEKLTGINVDYQEFDSNESMYSIIKTGGASYDLVIPSDYMISKMISEDMLQKINMDNIPNYKNISKEHLNKEYDPTNEYSIPYTFGKVGIIYNTKMVDEEDVKDKSWSLVFNEKYKGKILQFNNPRDAFAVAQFYLGLDVNSSDKSTWQQALELLKKQKPILQGYFMDETFNKMESGEAAIGVYYAGDFYTMYIENNDLAFYYPKEGTNEFYDAICIPKDAKNVGAAELFINYLLDPDVAFENTKYLLYGCPVKPVVDNPEYKEFLEEEISEDAYEIMYGDTGDLKTQVFVNLDTETNNYMNECWESLKSEGNVNITVIIITAAIVLVLLAIFIVMKIRSSKKRKYYEDNDEE